MNFLKALLNPSTAEQYTAQLSPDGKAWEVVDAKGYPHATGLAEAEARGAAKAFEQQERVM